MSGLTPEGHESENSLSSQILGNDNGNLYAVIDRDKVHGLNLSVPEDAKAVIKPWHEREQTDKYAESGVDDQVIFHIPFSQNVRVRSILLKLGRGESTPKKLRIYANHSNIIDFSDAETTRPQINISLLEGEVGVIEYPLRAAAFANINSLSLFFSDSVGGEITRLFYIGFKGETRERRRAGDTKLEIPVADAADAPLVDRLTEKTGGQQTTAR